jgi:hypothetical protein
MAFEEKDELEGPFPKAVGIIGGPFWRMGTFVERGDEVMGTEVAGGSMKGSGLSTTNVRSSLQMRESLLRT